MTLISLLILLLFLFALGAGLYWVIRKFAPPGIVQTLALLIAGALLVYLLLSQTIGTGFLNTPVV